MEGHSVPSYEVDRERLRNRLAALNTQTSAVIEKGDPFGLARTFFRPATTGTDAPKVQLQSLMRFLEDFVRGALQSLTSWGELVLSEPGHTNSVNLLNTCIGYWELEDDVIPEGLGVIGLVDDAYISNSILIR